MTPQQWNSIKAIFAAAAELPLPERAAYVERAAGADREVAEKVLKLLEQHDESDAFDLIPPQPVHSIQRGEVLAGRFRILHFVGRGGMGEVYAAEDLELGQRVALKTLRPDLLSDPEFLGRFRREVQLARQVTHPNICRIFDVGRDRTADRERVFLTMEFLDGQTLGDHLKQTGKLDRAAALPLLCQLAEGLTALHDQGIVHRDFKPGNVLVVRSASGTPRAVISDFGLARALEAESMTNLTSGGQVMGTPDYMAPEQLMGQVATPATDVYALGLVMYEMVTGKKAFPGGRVIENAVQRVVEQPSPPRAHSGDVPAKWEELILRCLAREPAARPSAKEVAEALQGQPLRPVFHALAFTPGFRMAIATILLIGLALWGLAVRLPGWRGSSTARAPQHIALMPLHVLSDEADLRVFALGLNETITSRLSQFDSPGAQQVVVVPASEVRSQDVKNAGDARKKFGVTAAVEGSIQSQGDRVRLLLTLVDTQSMRQVETISVEDQRANAMRLQDAAVSKLANALNLSVQPKYARDQEFSQVAPGAYEYYLQGRGYLQRSDQVQSLDSAVTMFERALKVDAKFAPAHSGLGEAYLSKYMLKSDPELVEKALSSAGRGLELNPSMAETHISMGRVHLGTGRYPEAQKNFEQAIELDGRSNEAYQGLANTFSKLGDQPRAEATYQKAITLRPGDWTGYKQLGLYYVQQREFDKALAQLSKVVDLSPDNAQGYVNLGAVQTLKGDLSAAEKTYLTALELDPKRLSTLGNLAKVFLDRGNAPRAIEMYERALQSGTKSYLLWGNLGMAYLLAGNRPKAVEAWEKAVRLIDAELLVNPKRTDLLSRLGFYRAYLGRTDFEEPLRKAMSLEPKNSDLVVRAAEAMVAAGKQDRALGFMRTALSNGYDVASLRRSTQLRELVDTVVSQRR